MAATVPGKGGPPSGAGPDEEASRAALLQTALELLQSSNDNKKFAGLLLVTKVAPAADAELLSRIHKAVGPSFLQRLLLPLREGSKPVANAGDMVSFGISIWAKLVDLPEIARSDEVKSLIPLLLKVVRNGGVDQALGNMQEQRQGEERGSQAAASEALHCILAAVQADAVAGRLALESGALKAATDTLRQAMSGKKHQEWPYHLILPAAQLLGALFQIQQLQPERVFVENEATLVQVVPLLAQALYVHDPRDKEQISLQLVCLTTLWQLLDLSELTRSHTFRQQLLASTSQWSACLRQGLQQILQAKAGPVQRMTALQLTSATLRLLGSRWVVEGGPDFLQVAAVVARIETGVLLLDALAASDEIRVPDTTFPVTATGGDVKHDGEQSGSVADDDDTTERMDSTRPGETQAKVDAVQVPKEMAWKAGPSQSARSRAMALLPVCFEVLEGCIEALAEAEDPSVESVTPLSPGAALSILKTIEEAVEAVLQFLEQVAAKCSGSDDHPVAIAGVRLLGRFLVDCPAAFGPRVRAILPFLLSCGSIEHVVGGPQDRIGQGTVFLLPVLVQLTEKPETSEEAVVPPQERQAWLGALARPAVLLPLLAYTRYCTLDALRAVTDEAMQHADIALVHSCQVLSVVLCESMATLGSSSSVAESGEEECTQIESTLLASMYALLKERGPDSLGAFVTLSVSTCAAWLMQHAELDQQLTPQQALRIVVPGLPALKADDSMAEMYCHALGRLLDGSRRAFCEGARQSAAIAAFLDDHAHPDTAFDPGTREYALVVRLQQIFASSMD